MVLAMAIIETDSSLQIVEIEMTTETLHPFELAGLGKSPFRYSGMRENVYSAAPGHSQAGGCCAYCYQGIRYECVIKSSDGKVFTVGMDCVNKLGRKDNKLVSEVKRAKLLIEKAKRDEAREKRREENRLKLITALQAQRDRNGGLTDREVQEAKEEAERKAESAKWVTANQWLLSVLKKEYQGDFVRSMIDQVSSGPVNGLSPKCVNILRNIFGKSHGRRGSKKYDAAVSLFDERIQ